MDPEIRTFALTNTLMEIQNICPDVKNSFIFLKNGQVLTGNPIASKKTITKCSKSFQEISDKTTTMGSIQSIRVQGSSGTLNISKMNDLYLGTITSADSKNDLTRTISNVLIPTILRLVDKLSSQKTSLKEESNSDIDEEESKKLEEHHNKNTIEQLKLEHELITEELGGFSVFSKDTVRIDKEILTEWKQRFDAKIEMIEIETFEGKKIECKVKSRKNPETKGLIQIPDKIMFNLEIKIGAIVKIKPVQLSS